MKNALPHNQAEQSAPNKRNFNGIGVLPSRKNTVTADVLARFLNGERLTGLDTVYEASTTRLGAVVFYLANNYGWQLQSIDKAAGCNDGRVAWVSEYFLPAEVITRAMAAGADCWCKQVREARRALRTNAALARTQAARANDAARRSNQTRQAGQWGLFEGGANA